MIRRVKRGSNSSNRGRESKRKNLNAAKYGVDFRLVVLEEESDATSSSSSVLSILSPGDMKTFSTCVVKWREKSPCWLAQSSSQLTEVFYHHINPSP